MTVVFPRAAARQPGAPRGGSERISANPKNSSPVETARTIRHIAQRLGISLKNNASIAPETPE